MHQITPTVRTIIWFFFFLNFSWPKTKIMPHVPHPRVIKSLLLTTSCPALRDGFKPDLFHHSRARSRSLDIWRSLSWWWWWRWWLIMVNGATWYRHLNQWRDGTVYMAFSLAAWHTVKVMLCYIIFRTFRRKFIWSKNKNTQIYIIHGASMIYETSLKPWIKKQANLLKIGYPQNCTPKLPVILPNQGWTFVFLHKRFLK